MKLQQKASMTMILFSITLLVLVAYGYNHLNYQSATSYQLSKLEGIAKELALHLESHLEERSAITITLASTPLIEKGLLESNKKLSLFSESDRVKKIDQMNRRWMHVEEGAPFVQSYLNNPIAEFLKRQQALFSDMYGEIFLTNRYGSIIATTGKLTTLAHSHKYWWKASWNDGKGKVFIDDRGYDASVKGYVIGIVVPVMKNGEVIGFLKSNIKILGVISDLIQNVSERYPVVARLVRSQGLIVYQSGTVPLSSQINEGLKACLGKVETISLVSDGEKEKVLSACSIVGITTGSESYGFGGKTESIDQLKGNRGESWSVVVSMQEQDAMLFAQQMTHTLIISGLIIILLASLLAWWLAHRAARPIVGLAKLAGRIGQGDLDAKAVVESNDEIGALAGSINQMLENLKTTLASRDELAHQIELRKQVEEALRSSYKMSYDLINNMCTGIYIYHYEEPDRLTLIDANRAAEEMTGIKLNAWKGEEFNDIWPAARELGLTDVWLNVARTGIAYETEDLSYEDERLMRAYQLRIFTLPGNRLAVSFSDITERKVLEVRLRNLSDKSRRLSRRLIVSSEDERRYLARELHDELGQHLAAINTIASVICRKSENEQSIGWANDIRDIVKKMFGDVRSMLVRINPDMLEALGLFNGISKTIDYWHKNSDVEIAFEHSDEQDDFPDEINTAIYRVVQECLSNVAKHASASRVVLKLSVNRDKDGQQIIGLDAQDNGIGADMDRANMMGLGMIGMQERVHALNGSCDFISSPGNGMHIVIAIPLPS